MLTPRRLVALASPIAALLGGLLAGVTTRPAAADVLASALGQPLVEVSHAVDVTVKDGVATYRVQRVFANRGTVADEARLDIDLPYGGAATGLRIRARSQWFEGELMEAEKAAALYQELTGRGIWKPKDPALLYWRWADKLALQVFPVLPGATSTVEYTLTVPTRYAGGTVVLSYPRLSATAAANLAAPVFTLRPAWGDATTRVVIDGERVATETPIVLTPRSLPPWLEAFGADPAASYAASVIEIADDDRARKRFTKAKLTLDLEHTYKGDLRIALVTPAGASIAVYDGSGGGDNDVRGSFDLALPPDTAGAGTWRLVMSDHAALDAGTLASWSLTLGAGKDAVTGTAADTPVFVPDAPENASDGGVARIELAPPPITELTARLGRVVASPASAFGRLEVDVAPELRPLPKRAQVVFVLDASHSMGPEGIDAQLALVKAYVSHVPDALVELVLYRRTAVRLFGSFVATSELDARLAAARAAGTLAPGNGSALDEGARVASAALKPRKGPRRIVLISDRLLRPRWTNASALTALAATPADVVVHLVTTDVRGGDVPALTRDDLDPLAPIPLAHRGILATLAGPDRAGKRLAGLVLGLVRPIQIDGFAIKGLDLSAGRYDDTIPAALREGSGLRLVVAGPNAPTKVELTGMVWGDRYSKTVAVDAGFSRAAAGWVFSEDDHQDLSPAEMMTVALMGRAVSPVTSYLATEPGVRPSTIGLERGSMGFGSRSGAMGGSYAGQGGSIRMPPDLMALVSGGAKACVAKHRPAAGWAVAVAVETTYDEIVDVHVTTGASLAIAPCLVEAVWAARLTAAFDAERDTFTLAFP